MATAAIPPGINRQVIERLLPRPAEQVIKSKFLRTGWYGLNGAGKTSLLATCTGNWWVVSVDKENCKPLRDHANIRVIPMREWEDLDDILYMARTTIRAGKLDGIAFDTWTRIQAHALNHICRRPVIDPFNDQQIAQYMDEGPAAIPEGGWGQWRAWGALMAAWMDFFNELECHTAFLFQELTKQPKFENDILRTEPMLRPEALNRAFESLELLGRLYVTTDGGAGSLKPDPNNREIDETTVEMRKLLLGQHPRYAAKGDTKRLGYVISEPTWDKIAGPVLNGLAK
jgi:hypothetical protein